MSFIKKIVSFLLKLFYRDYIFLRYKPLKNITSSEVSRCIDLVPMTTIDNPLDEDVRIKISRAQYDELPYEISRHFEDYYG
ncbi:hypothetical protein EVB94_186 [Rhizobium phage RHph_TM40]|uniref:Uncharacterized protein n=2 Tax=Cuauhnahuacvirus TaxID=3044696 RepID=A0A7S5R7X0_9CAUD|nr:hypothetical protein PQC16_gp187 [Rhizobium phage RHph_TM30]YP_010671337.1 hypothetical protein PQC17_gp188 [Rhizobium phage RHph_Y65]QIG71657.1 hypothetical protein EVB94_186 [Rhizobium phage RHph_TM40]QIG72020.1 hypothetical protein EVB95_186 [Rhizobium phage RHph_TM2_3B]QIG72383.1 hypothetical protein EVB96_187 [Rhizobium phage RHph_TM3_3_6]QIG77773.1 hypothetical protein EVB64_186 [Rhizobium phage RHph_TM61]QIG71294.1 hypothetical protein EVB93_187 [Rhizobium phage RHph_TM30]